MSSIEDIKALRERTGLSINECKLALDEAGGDSEKALAILKSKGAEIAAKKSSRTLGSGIVHSYIHGGGAVGVLLELFCETDFVAKNPEFKAIANDISMHIAAMNPNDLTELLEQPFIKNPSEKISDLINGAVQKFGERTEIGRFARFSIK